MENANDYELLRKKRAAQNVLDAVHKRRADEEVVMRAAIDDARAARAESAEMAALAETAKSWLEACQKRLDRLTPLEALVRCVTPPPPPSSSLLPISSVVLFLASVWFVSFCADVRVCVHVCMRTCLLA
jgi:hypothetical protein